MKWILALLMNVPTFAMPQGEYQNSVYGPVLITPKYFIFRHCGRYQIINQTTGEVTLFTGQEREEGCLPRGQNVCRYQFKKNELVLECQ